MPGLFENQTFLSMLSNLGGAMGGKGSFAANINAANQQQISANSTAKLMQQILGGGAKLTADKDGMTMKLPSTLLGSEGVGSAASALFGPDSQTAQNPVSLATTPAPAPATTPATQPQAPVNTNASPQVGAGNPFANPSYGQLLEGADLAGLTPDVILSALRLGMVQDEMKRKSVNDLLDAQYNQMRVQALREKNQPKESLVGGMNLEQFKSLPPDMRGYLYYKQSTGSDLGFADYKKLGQDQMTSDMKNFNASIGNPEFRSFLKEKSGGIADAIAKAAGLGEDKYERELMQIDRVDKDIADALKADPVNIYKRTTDPKEMAKFKKGLIEQRITGGGGVITSPASFNPQTGIATWSYRTKSGKDKTFNYQLYQGTK